MTKGEAVWGEGRVASITIAHPGDANATAAVSPKLDIAWLSGVSKSSSTPNPAQNSFEARLPKPRPQQAGFAGLCLSMTKHFHAALAVERAPPRLPLIVIASLCILGACWLLAADYGWPIAVTLSLGLASLAGGLVVLVMAYQPSALPVHALIAGLLTCLLRLAS